MEKMKITKTLIWQNNDGSTREIQDQGKAAPWNPKFTLKDIERELTTELKMRRKVWRQLHGLDGVFFDSTHQRRYDILKYLLEKLEFTPLQKWEDLVKHSESAASIVAAQLELDLE